MIKIFVDTSAFLAAINDKDDHHNLAKDIFKKITSLSPVLYTTNYIRAETHAMLNRKLGRKTALNFLADQSCVVEWIAPEDEATAIELLKRYYDKSYSLTDATSFVIMERLGIKTAIAFDQHFAQYGFNLPPLQ